MAGTVTTSVVSDVSMAQAAAAVKVVTSNGTITGYAYSNTTMTTQIGTFTTTPAGATQAATAGIIKTPSSYGQGSTVDDFYAQG